MMLLKNIGRTVPLGYYLDSASRQIAFKEWVTNSLTPFFSLLEKSIIDEFQLAPEMVKYDVTINQTWYTNLSSIDLVEPIIDKVINTSGCEDFQLQLAIECTHPHVTWGTVLNINLSSYEVIYDEEEFTCYFIILEPIKINLDEFIPLSTAQQLIESILIELRINYVQNS